ncbi:MULTISPECIES: DNA polymerase III subunit gamma/tau [unclassified Bacillus (in: firmicutes)]|uniref:DNA polymerase III subunit gamma/tau n=1 Tax=unclassified Bacillus (in: firmicutes) TaxID=185979 RepID=UPI0008E54DFE|nr:MULTISPECIES: DNA polymerase III subunit gamma/tau [unclassified Bacillus (in: firmicutes)]SFB26625.1 DNA polymerase-3 subunit gamma/tau [Bacillus sp. UNCCL13]SFQ92015.1 DNA polymerase III, tau subunit [Bacillus sp. cl95]
MSYQALYRVWRPQQFLDVVGQEHVTKTLQNALLQQKISHAYLFSGPRGTGKTSAAKILAKAVNCERAPVSEPCNECASCKGITDGSIPDVIEIDAASNNGVEEIRDIRDKVKYAPSVVKYKVYIVDEVHMLSIGAFNALLKTLEEPPKHVMFILATTEPHKIPLTIISRCQRFDFKRITAKSIVGRMKLIVDETGVNCDDRALNIIARAAEGGMRDALSLLDQAISFSHERVEVEDALTVTGSVSQGFLNTLARSIQQNDAALGLAALEELLYHGKDPSRFMEDFILYYRDMLLYKAAPSLEESMERVLMDEDFQQLSGEITAEQIYQLIEVLNKAQQEMRWTNHPRVFLEVAIVKLCQLESVKQSSVGSADFGPLLQRIEQLEGELNDLKRNGPTVVSQETSQQAQKNTQRSSRKGFQAPAGKINEVLKQATKANLNIIKSHWGEMLSRLNQQQMRSQAALLTEAEPVAASTSTFVVKFKYEIHCQMAMENDRFLEVIAKLFQDLTGTRYTLVGAPEEQWQRIRESFLSSQHGAEDSEINEKQQEDPVVVEAQKLFGPDLVEIID